MEQYECGLRYRMFVGDTLMNREKFFEGNTREEAENKRQRYLDKLQDNDNFYDVMEYYN